MIKITCAKCCKELYYLGAVVISPPLNQDSTLDDIFKRHKIPVDKYHLCVDCWENFCSWLCIEEK